MGRGLGYGQRPAWDPEVLTRAFDDIRFLPAELRGDAYADPVPVPDDAPLIDRLVAWNGRQPCEPVLPCGR